MSDEPRDTEADVVEWAREITDAAVNEIMDKGVIDAEIFEARPVWWLPFRIVIGQIRDTHRQTASVWIIGGHVPTDYVSTDAAPTPRDAARHFALKWQLDAARYKDPNVQEQLGADHKDDWERIGEVLARTAEALADLAADDRHWQPGG